MIPDLSVTGVIGVMGVIGVIGQNGEEPVPGSDPERPCWRLHGGAAAVEFRELLSRSMPLSRDTSRAAAATAATAAAAA